MLDGKSNEDDTTIGRPDKEAVLDEGEISGSHHHQNGLIIGTISDWSSDRDQSNINKDEIDLAIQKCLEDQTSLKKLKIQKVTKGQYLLENKQYPFKLL